MLVMFGLDPEYYPLGARLQMKVRPADTAICPGHATGAEEVNRR